MENFSNFDQFFNHLVNDKLSNQTELNLYRENLKNILDRLEFDAQNISKEFYNLIKKTIKELKKQVKANIKLQEIVDSQRSSDEEYRKERLNKSKQIMFGLSLHLLKFLQLYLLNYNSFLEKIKKKQRKDLAEGSNLIKHVIIKIIESIQIVEPEKNNEIINEFLAKNLTIIYLENNQLKTTLEQDNPKQKWQAEQYAAGASMFAISFAQKLTTKDFSSFYSPIQKKLELKIETDYNPQEIEEDSSSFFKNLINDLRLTPHNLLYWTNNTITALHQKFLGIQENESTVLYKKTIKEKTKEFFIQTIKNTGAQLRQIQYSWLRKFIFGIGGNLISQPDTIARTTGEELVGNNSNQIADFIKEKYINNAALDYFQIIYKLANTYHSVSAINFTIRKTCITGINQLINLFFSSPDTEQDINLLVSIYKVIPKEAAFLKKIHNRIKNSFNQLTVDKKIEFLAGIIKQEQNSNSINEDFKGLILNLAEEAKNLPIEQINHIIQLAERQNSYLKDKFRGFINLFKNKKQKSLHRISKATLTELDTLLRDKKAKKYVEDVKNKIIIQQEESFEETQNNLIKQYNDEIEEFITKEKDDFINKTELDTENRKKLQDILDSAKNIETKEKEIASLIKQQKIDGYELTSVEIAQIRKLLEQHENFEKQKKELYDNTSKPTQQTFYAVFLSKLDSLFIALRTISTGYIQTYDSQATGMLSAVFNTAGNIPIVGSVFKGISSLLNWANHKKLTTQAKEIASIGLTSSDDALLARSLAIAVTKLLNDHPNKKLKLRNIEPTSIITLINYILRKLVVILIKENSNNYQMKIHTTFETFIARCIEQLTTAISKEEKFFDFNENVENFFQAPLFFHDQPPVEAEELLKQAKNIEIISFNTLNTDYSESYSQKPKGTPIVKVIDLMSEQVRETKRRVAKIEQNQASQNNTNLTSEQENDKDKKIENLTNEVKNLEHKVKQLENSIIEFFRTSHLQNSIDYEGYKNYSVTPKSPRKLLAGSEKFTNENQKTKPGHNNSSNTHSGLSFVKNNLTIPARGEKKYKTGEILGDLIYLEDKPAGIEPGFLCFLLNKDFYEKAFVLIKNIIKSDQTNSKKTILFVFAKEYLKTLPEELTQEDVTEFIKNDDCRNIILKNLQVQRVLPVWLIKQDYEDPKNPGDTQVTIRLQDFQKTNNYKRKSALFGQTFTGAMGEIFRRRDLTDENVNAILECLSTSLAGIYFKTQTQRLLKGTYIRQIDKYMTASLWEHNFTDFKDKLHLGYLVKLDKNRKKISYKIEYNQTVYIADNQIKYLGASKLFMLISNDRDAIGSEGNNKGEANGEFFGIDCGHAFRKKNTFIEKLQDDFSIIPPSEFKNFSIFDDTSLSECMQSVLILAKLRGGIELPKEVIESYGLEFAAKLAAIEIKQDLKIFEEYLEYFSLHTNTDKNYCKYHDSIMLAQQYYTEASNTVLKIFENRLSLTAQQLDLLDNLEKLCNKTTNRHTKDDEIIIFNHLKKLSRKTIWQLEAIKDNDGNTVKLRFYCNKKEAKKTLLDYLEKTKSKISIRIAKNDVGIEFEIEPAYFDEIYQGFLEEKVAVFKKQSLAKQIEPRLSRASKIHFSGNYQSGLFHHFLKTDSNLPSTLYITTDPIFTTMAC